MRSHINNTFADQINIPNQKEILGWIKNKAASKNFISFAIVFAAHLILLLTVAIGSKISNQPVLSFTVTMMDVSATSSNTIASAASVSSKSASKIETKTEQNKSELAQPVNEAQKNVIDDSQAKTKNAQSYDSIQQSAVISVTKKAVYDAAYLHNDAPAYPALSRQFEEQGIVLLNVLVGADGKAQKAVINKSSGYARLDNAALKTVSKWNFIPAKQGENNVATWVQIPINFVLENQ